MAHWKEDFSKKIQTSCNYQNLLLQVPDANEAKDTGSKAALPFVHQLALLSSVQPASLLTPVNFLRQRE